MLTQTDRVAVLAALARIEAELAQIAPWLDGEGYERASVLAEDAVRSLWACQLLVDRDPDRAKLLAPHGRALHASENGPLWTLGRHLRICRPKPVSKTCSVRVGLEAWQT